MEIAAVDNRQVEDAVAREVTRDDGSNKPLRNGLRGLESAVAVPHEDAEVALDKSDQVEDPVARELTRHDGRTNSSSRETINPLRDGRRALERAVTITEKQVERAFRCVGDDEVDSPVSVEITGHHGRVE